MDKIKINQTEFLDDDLDAVIEQQYQNLLADPLVHQEIKRLGATPDEVKQNIAMFLAYQEDRHYCSSCPGLEQCDKRQRHYQIKLERVGRFIERTYEPCPLLMAKYERDRKFWISDFDEAWKEKRFTDIDGKASRKALLEEAIALIKGQSDRWLFITGGHRIGKTYLMVMIINELLNGKARQAAIINAGARFKELLEAAINDKSKFKEMFDRYTTIDVLGIDDFGNEYKTDFLRDQIVYPMLLERAKNKKITLFTSDFKITELGTLYSNSESGRIRSRQLVRLLTDYAQKELEISGLSNLY
ncbi:MAG: DnaA/Hda family protein [Candidatus Izemoplasmatales bacterium]|nr:DnaA/Hda family protein [Candidatus Izemoplasmatales bacterium]